jgi:3-(3-hydroxy-phenyl)propionate hydroxylase
VAWLIRRDDLGKDRLAPFADRLRQWLADHGVEAVLVRPDRYVYGAGQPDALRTQWQATMGTIPSV